MVRFHQLKASFEFFINPARNVLQTLRGQSTAIPEASIYGCRILILKAFDDHIEQRSSSTTVSLVFFYTTESCRTFGSTPRR